MEVKILLVFVCTSLAVRIKCNKDDDDFPERNYMNTSINPCDDFYEYTCGNFKNVFPLENDTLTIDHFTLLEEELIKIANQILSQKEFIDDPKSLNKSKSAYKACVDTDYLNKVKNPEKTIVKAEKGFPMVETAYNKSLKYGFNEIGDAVSKYGIPMIFNLESLSSMIDATKNVIYIYELDATSLTPAETGNIRPHRGNSYEEHIEKGFWEMGEGQKQKSRRKKRSSDVMPFDIFLRRMAFKIRDAVESTLTDDQVLANLQEVVNFTRGVYRGGVVGNDSINDFNGDTITLKDLNVWTKMQFNDTIDLDWVEFVRHVYNNTGIDITDDIEIVCYPGFAEFLYGIINMVRITDPSVVKSYVLMKIFTHLAPESDGKSRQYLTDYFTSLNYQVLPRWKYCTRKIIDSVGTAGLSFAVAYEYQMRHFNVNKFNQVVQMIEYLQSAFKELMENSTWMDSDSKAKALQKLDNMIVILGHPNISYRKGDLDKFYENLRICKWDNYGNSIRLKAFKNAYQISTIARRDRAVWQKSPFECNAYYNAINNRITIPIAMLNPVFFGNKNLILDYGRIGAIIGHEITHGFDSEGMKYGPKGTLQKWWTSETTSAFVNRTACFVNEYNQFYEPEIDHYVNGTITLNENIADNGGVREAYLAMKKFIKMKGIKNGTSEFSPEQLFFIGFGTLWCNNPSQTYLEKMKTNEHARSKYRVNGVVSNIEQFSEAFNCPTGSKMNPENKCRLW